MEELCLSDAQKKHKYKLVKINISNEKLKNYYMNLGFRCGEEIEVITSNYGKKSYMIRVMGILYAMDKNLCEKFIVESE